MRIGLALGSGGARGLCHIGIIKGLAEIGIEADVAAGCSAGALVGAAWAGGCLDALEDWALSLTRQSFLRYVDLGLGGGGLVHGRAITDVLSELGVAADFDELARPFLAVATDMETGREIWLQRGAVLPAVRASVSIPGVFSPYKVNGRWLLDGGLVNPVPVSATRALGADVTIAINPNGRDGSLWLAQTRDAGVLARLTKSQFSGFLPETMRQLLPEPSLEQIEQPPQYLDVVSTAIDIMTGFVLKTRLTSDPPHFLLEARLPELTFLEFFRAEEAIAEGRRLVLENAEGLRSLCHVAENEG